MPIGIIVLFTDIKKAAGSLSARGRPLFLLRYVYCILEAQSSLVFFGFALCGFVEFLVAEELCLDAAEVNFGYAHVGSDDFCGNLCEDFGPVLHKLDKFVFGFARGVFVFDFLIIDMILGALKEPESEFLVFFDELVEFFFRDFDHNRGYYSFETVE